MQMPTPDQTQEVDTAFHPVPPPSVAAESPPIPHFEIAEIITMVRVVNCIMNGLDAVLVRPSFCCALGRLSSHYPTE